MVKQSVQIALLHEMVQEMQDNIESLEEELERMNDKFDALSSCLKRDIKEFKEDHTRRTEMYNALKERNEI